jgi:hypothetical protein
VIDQIVEERIQAAMACVEFDHLPGAGKPLQLDDERMIPEHLRMAYRILKNAGFIPPELEALQEINQLQALIGKAEEGENRRRAGERLRYLCYKLEASGLIHTSRAVIAQYEETLLNRLDRPFPTQELR